MKLKSSFLPISVPEKRLVTWVLSCIVLFLLPQPVLGDGDPLTITEDMDLSGPHMGNIIIGANGITLDCHGNDVIGPGDHLIDIGTRENPDPISVGIELTKRRDVIIKNCNVYGFDTAFRLDKSKRNELRDNTATANDRFGFLLIDSDRNELTGNAATDNDGHGFALGDSDKNELQGNTATFSGALDVRGRRNGFFLFDSDDNSLVDNTANRNGQGDPGLVGRADGFLFFQSDDNTVTENEATLNLRHGFLFFQSDDNTVTENTSNGNDIDGFGLFDKRTPEAHAPLRCRWV